ncbi:MAG: hypothetical protein KDD43_03085 [Bdellovibrionales bacterium]|nr:hypothetical protein [Bdellovibrionales bacterium]
MDPKTEREISQLLKRWSNPEKVAEIVSGKLAEPDLRTEEELSLFNFLIHSGRFRSMIKPLQTRLKTGKPIPWGPLVEMFARNKIRPSKDVLDALFTGALEQGKLENLIQSHGWDDYDGRFKPLREELQERLLDDLDRKKEVLKEKLGFLSNHRMIEEEEKVLALLLRMFPEDSEIQAHHLEFQERWARNVLASQRQGNIDIESLLKGAIKWTKKEEELLALWLEEATKISQNNPQLAYSLCLFFYFIEAYPQAFTILQMAPNTPQRDWLTLELLIECRRFVECLAAVDQVEVAYSDDPETTFSAAYIRARALHGLGQDSQALEILQGIVNVRPNYRSAKTLIHEWAGGVG